MLATTMRRFFTTTVIRRGLATSALTTIAIVGASGAHAQAGLPTGGTVASGGASIRTGASKVTIHQTTNRAIVNWTGFDVGVGKSVVFDQPSAHAAILNRVTGGTGSNIAGQIKSNGAVYLVNPNGIAITSTGTVNTGGGFVASTLGIADADFNAGKLDFTGTGASQRVSNKGTITANSGGYVALLGGTVLDSGTITVALGRVGLGSGENIALDLTGDGFMRVAVPTAAVTAGDTAMIDMAGKIAAAGGRVVLSAATVKGAVRNVINLSGSINASSAVGDGGSIVLLGGAGGTVTASGTLDARATGGTGKGGFVETSGANVNFAGLNVDTSAVKGATGIWLVDPTDLTIDAAAASTISTNLATSNVTLQTDATTANGPGIQTPGNGDITIASAINWASANTLSLFAYNNIALNAAITGTAGGLTLQAGNNVANTGAVSATGAVNVGLFNLTNGNWVQNSVTLPAFAARDFRFANAKASFLRATGGTGAAGSAYQIADVYGLQGVASRNLLNKNFTLGKDIDASGTVNWNAGAGFVPIGSSTANGQNFIGNFDGANHVIRGLTINRTGIATGLFGVVANAATTIANVGLIGGSVSGGQQVGALVGRLVSGNIANAFASASVTGIRLVGGLVGEQDDGTVRRVYASGNVTSTGDYTGGLIGYSGTGVSDSYATGAVSSTGMYTGGLLGFVGTPVTNTYATGAVTSTGDYTGGLIGFTGSTINQSYASGAVSGTTNVGGLAGSSVNDPTHAIVGSYWDVYSTGQAQASGTVANDPGATAVTSDPSQTAAANYAYKATAYAGLTPASGIGTATPTGFVFVPGNTTRPFLAFEVPVVGNAGVATNAVNQILLTNSHQLQLLAYNGATLAASYALANSINLAETGRAVLGTPGSYSGMWSGNGFVPIGTDGTGMIWDGAAYTNTGTVGFSGSLEGGNYVVDRLFVDRVLNGVNARNIGLFGFTSAGTISNLGTTNGSIRGRQSVGGLVGTQNGGTLSNVYSTNTVVGTTLSDGGLVGAQNPGSVIVNAYATGNVSGSGNVGGLVGLMRGTLTNGYATGTITATSGASAFGGLIGFANGGTVTNAYASGAVVGGSGRSAGGLIGSSSGTNATYVYATGAVAGFDQVGGLIGSQSGGTIDNSYAAGAVTGAGGSDIGALVGNAQGTFTNGYWDSYSSGQTVASGFGGIGATEVTSNPTQAGAANYAFKASAYGNLATAAGVGTQGVTGFVFAPGNNTRPLLAFEVPVAGNPLVATNGASQQVLINSHQLQLVNYNATTLAGNYALDRNIDLSETGRVVAGTPGSYGGIWGAAGFVPLGSDGTGNLWNGSSFVPVAYYDIGSAGVAPGFTGSLNGGNFTLSGLFINRPTSQNVGLFGGTSGSISNLTLTGRVTGYVSTGGLIGVMQGGSVRNVASAVNVNGSTGSAYVGGMIGFASGATISGSSASGVVGASGVTGGLIGLLYNSTLINSSSSATVTGKAGKVGGLVGAVERATVTGGSSTATVNGVAGGPAVGSLRDGGTYNTP